MTPLIPTTVVTGFLGSGKTTLMNRILNGDHGLKIAVMVNDFGAINIDSQLIVSAEQNMVNLANGCICCTVESDLIEQLHKLLSLRERPEHILIETSGVSAPSKVVNTLRYPQFRDRLRVDAVVAMVDSEQFCELEGEMAQLAMDQLSVADIVVLNKTDVASPEQLQQLREKWLYPQARTFETHFADIPIELLLGVKAADRSQSTSHHHKDNCCVGHPEFTTFNWDHELPLDLKKLRQAFKALPSNIYRAKGFVQLSEAPQERCLLQMVGTRVEMEKNGPWPKTPRSQIVFIGWGELEVDQIQTQLELCLAEDLKE